MKGARAQVTLKSVASLMNEASLEIAVAPTMRDFEVVFQLHKG